MREFWLHAAAAAVIAYLCGCFNGAVIVSKYILRDDVRRHGSGNAGLTNFHRTFGGPLTLVVISLDVVKAVAAVLAGKWLFQSAPALWGGEPGLYGKYWAAVFCELGHMFPAFFRFQGGKGILSGGAILLMLDWRIALVSWGGFLLLTALTRYVSLGSSWAGGVFPFTTWFVYRDWITTVCAVVVGGLILFQHRGNIRRLAAGNENRLTFRKR